MRLVSSVLAWVSVLPVSFGTTQTVLAGVFGAFVVGGVVVPGGVVLVVGGTAGPCGTTTSRAPASTFAPPWVKRSGRR